MPIIQEIFVTLRAEKIENNNNIDIRTFSDLSKNCYIEKKLLMGFIKPELKERRYRKNVPKYKSTINIYKKEWEMNVLHALAMIKKK